MATFILLSDSELAEVARCLRIAAEVEQKIADERREVAVSFSHRAAVRWRLEMADRFEAARHYPPV